LTSGFWRTLASTEAGTVGCVPPFWLVSIGLRGVMAASVPLLASEKIWSNDELIVSVKMYVPAMRQTPRATARAVSAMRSLRANSPRKATFCMGLADRLHQVQDVVGAVAGLLVVDEAPVGQHEQAIGVRGGGRVVRDHDDRLAELVDGAA
jgi:hypothetical protein